MTDSANVIRLEPDVKRHVRARLARLPAHVHALHRIGHKSLASVLLRYFDTADDALFDFADKAQSNAEQNSYFEAMRELRVQRSGIERRLFAAIDEQFARLVASDDRDEHIDAAQPSADALSLVGNDDLEQMVALEATIGRASVQYEAQIEPLFRALGKLIGKEIKRENFPFGVQPLCHAAMDQFKRLEIDIKAKLTLFHLFEKQVINQLGAVNQSMLVYLSEQGIDVGEELPPEPVALAFEPSADPSLDANRRELLKLLSFMQKLPLGPSSSQGLDIERILETVQHRRGVELNLGRLEQETINLVQMLFRFILQGQNLAAPMQELICRLQVPVLKVALLDSEFLMNKKHPARRLLNQFAAVAAQWQSGDKNEHSQPVYQFMRGSVDRILARFEQNISVFAEVLADFTAVLEKDQRAAMIQEQRTVDAEDGKAKAAQARQHVAAEIAAKTQGKELPSVVLELINGPWSNVLYVTGLKYGFGSTQWSAELKVLSDLVLSVQPCRDSAQRRQRIGLMPDLLQRMRSGLDAVSYNPFEVEALFAELEEAHLECIRAPVGVPAGEAPPNEAAPSEAPGREQASHPPASLAEPSEPVPMAVAEKPVDEDESAELPLDDPHIIAVSTFTHGAWFDLTAEPGQTQRCRLAAYIKPTDKYIFVDRNGVKVAEQTRNQLALALKHGRLTPLDNNTLFDRALESVVTSLRKTPTVMPLDRKDD